MSVQRFPAPGAELRVVSSQGSDRGQQADQHQEGHHAGRAIRVPLRPRPKPPGPRKTGPKPRTRSARRAGGARGAQDPEGDVAFEADLEQPEEVDEHAMKSASTQMDDQHDSSGRGSSGGQRGFGGNQHRQPGSDDGPAPSYRPARPEQAQHDIPRRLRELGLPGASELFDAASKGASSAHAQMETFAGVMLGALRRTVPAGAPSPARLALSCAQAVLRRQGPGAPPTTLSDAKQVLIAQSHCGGDRAAAGACRRPIRAAAADAAQRLAPAHAHATPRVDPPAAGRPALTRSVT